MKTIRQALIDEIVYPLPEGKIDNIIIKRDFVGDENFTSDVANADGYRGALADCLISLLQAINFSESDKSIGSLSDETKKRLLAQANKIYTSIGEDEVILDPEPMVYINC